MQFGAILVAVLQWHGRLLGWKRCVCAVSGCPGPGSERCSTGCAPWTSARVKVLLGAHEGVVFPPARNRSGSSGMWGKQSAAAVGGEAGRAFPAAPTLCASQASPAAFCPHPLRRGAGSALPSPPLFCPELSAQE